MSQDGKREGRIGRRTNGNGLEIRSCPDIDSRCLMAGWLAIGPVWAQSVTDLPVPTARIDAERHLPVELLQTVADRHARLVWGENAVGGHYFPLTDRDGAVRAYVFNYVQNRENLPAVETIFATIRELRAEHRVYFSRSGGRDRLFPKFYADLERRLGRWGPLSSLRAERISRFFRCTTPSTRFSFMRMRPSCRHAAFWPKRN